MVTKQDESDDPTVGAGHNRLNDEGLIREVMGNVIRLEGERKAINEDINEQKARLKAIGYKMVNFSFAKRQYELEQEERDEDHDQIRILFDALGLRKQAELFSPEEVGTMRDGSGNVVPIPPKKK